VGVPIYRVNGYMSKRTINGILLLDKPVGMSSNQALQIVKRLYAMRKAGHTGSLDPLASGLLPICFNEATKLSQYLLNSDKTYRVSLQLGVRTATGDAEGEVIARRPVPALHLADIERSLARFRGDIEQVPSMYSALKHQGKPLYELARQGITVDREPRRLTVYRLTVLAFTQDTIQFELHCSKGTYVRTLVDDFGEILGCGAHVTALRRLTVGGFSELQMVDLERLRSLTTLEELDQHLLPLQSALSHWPQVSVAESILFYLRQGSPVVIAQAPTSGWVCLVDKQSRFIGVGEIQEDGRVAPRRLLS
jgi:tRNA pseudouridine55 synthase